MQALSFSAGLHSLGIKAITGPKSNLSTVLSSYNTTETSTECPTSYRTRHFFDNFTTNEDIATKFEADLPHCVRNVTTS
jgi:hypothetical protein